MATEYLDKAGLQKLVQLIQAMPDDATLEFVDGKLQVKSPLPVANGGTGANTVDGVLSNLGIEDKIVDKGKSGIWYYIKFESGYAIMWANYKGSTIGTSGWSVSDINVRYRVIGDIAFPFNFAQAADCVVVWENGNRLQAYFGSGQSNWTDHFTLNSMLFATPSWVGQFSPVLSIFAAGRWK